MITIELLGNSNQKPAVDKVMGLFENEFYRFCMYVASQEAIISNPKEKEAVIIRVTIDDNLAHNLPEIKRRLEAFKVPVQCVREI